MGFGVRTGKPPDSGESAAADLKEQWNLRAQNCLARRGGGSSSPAQRRPATCSKNREARALGG
jgi:hypothetical protein